LHADYSDRGWDSGLPAAWADRPAAGATYVGSRANGNHAATGRYRAGGCDRRARYRYRWRTRAAPDRPDGPLARCAVAARRYQPRERTEHCAAGRGADGPAHIRESAKRHRCGAGPAWPGDRGTTHAPK